MDRMSHHQIDTGTGTFSRDPSGLPMAEPTEEITLDDGDRLDLRIAPVANRIGDSTVRIWQPSIGRMVRIVRHPEPVLAVAWNADGSRLYSACKDGILRLLDGDSDEVLRQHKVGAWALTSLAVSATSPAITIGDSRGQTNSFEK